ncbi:SDR family oxidoreductase [Aureitalea marina]|uniref:Short-chain dehydrogenase n=1 Tax=Aureitalea marina TaxID=930804 RepID=A0A2S7KMD3_9FLAO|nr:SDR family oxidoreductase [Aureitalea marina]PQB03750.1 short-chain dehydrogenase [Aureitalea marina]
MNLNLTNKNALVCGSSAGIGKATAILLSELGAQVTLLARNEQKLQTALQELHISNDQEHNYLTADFDKPEELKKALLEATLKTDYHILINNTGGPRPGTAFSAEVSEYETAFRQHLICNQILVQSVVPAMKQAGFGRIVNVISTSVKQPIEGLGVSNTIRGAVANWSKTLSFELGPHGITINNVLPGFTETERLDDIVKGASRKMNTSEEGAREFMKKIVPLRRFAQPSEIASAIAFLCTDAAGYITGINVPVDGGRTKSL